MSAGNGWTPIEGKIIAILDDGKVHSVKTLLMCLDSDGLAEKNALQVHLVNLRKKLRPRGRDIINRWGEGYQQVRLLHDPNAE